MAEWNERGYVPDSDDEEDEVLGLVSRDGQFTGTKFNAEHKGGHFGSENHETTQLSCPEIQAACSIENRDSLVLTDAPHHDLKQSEDDLGWLLHQPENEQDARTRKDDKEEENNPMPNQGSATMNHTEREVTRNSVAEQLRNELKSGLRIVNQVLGGSSATDEGQFDHQSGLSSPLSSAKSFSAEPSQGDDIPGAVSKGPLLLDNRSLEQPFAESIDNRPNHLPSFGPGVQPMGRSLRQRNAIQLYPYALEGARYQKELLAHGVKPVYVAGFLRQRSSDRDVSDHEFPEGNAGEHSADSTLSEQDCSGPLQPISHNAVRKRPRRPLLDDDTSDQELPDLDAILEGKHRGVQQIKKRSIVADNVPQTIRNLDDENEFHVYDLPSDSRGFTLGGSPSHATFHVPASPPGSRSVQSSQSAEAPLRLLMRKNLLRRRTPEALPTPNLSSATHQPTELALQLDDDSQSLETGATQDSSRPGSQQSLECGDGQILQLQRKTKGVLPASFFRLQDQQSTASRNQDRHRSLLPDRNGNVPGIAHRLHQARNQQTSSSRASNNAIVVSDDSPSEADSSTQSIEDFAASNSPKRYDDIMGLVGGDIEEDNAIDMMIQPQSRKRRVADPTKKRQRQISGFSLGTNDHPWNERTPRRTPKRRKGPINTHLGRQRRDEDTSKARAPSLGPTDAPGYTDLPRASRPCFLRVATRLATSRRACGRQSPSRKFIRLATTLDTHDANTELTNWREGRLKQNTKMPVHNPYRKPRQQHLLGPAQSLERGSQGVPVSGSRKLLASRIAQSQWQIPQHAPFHRRTEGLIQGITLRQSRFSNPLSNVSSEPVQRSLDDGMMARLGPLVSVHTRHQNRSGRGMLLSSTTDFAKPREAQFESSVQPKPGSRILDAIRGSLTASRIDEASNVIPEAQSHQTFVRHLEGATPDALLSDGRRQSFPRSLRKRSPRQIDAISMNAMGQPELSEHGIDAAYDDLDPLAGVALAGLGSPDLPITRDFGIAPFRVYTPFDATTFIGQGQLFQLIRNLIRQPRRLVLSTSDIIEVIRPSVAKSPYRWGLWDTHVSQELSAWFVELKECLGIQDPQNGRLLHSPPRNVLAATISLTFYVSCHAFFKDHHGLTAFAKEAFLMSQDLVWQIESQCRSNPLMVSPTLLRLLCLLLVFIFEIACVTASTSADRGLQTEVCKTFRQLALVVLKVVFQEDRLAKIVRPPISGRDMYTIGSDSPEAEALVIINNLSKQPILELDVWELITEALLSCVGSYPERLVTFHDYDRCWKGIFSALPLLEVDASGLLQRKSGSPGWNLVQQLLARFFSLFMPQRYHAGYSTKYYGRILFQRCLDLVQVWGWQGGHPAVGTIFDAYHINNLNEMFGETPNHSFCIPLNPAPSSHIHVEKTDPGFHAFLGFLAQTILDSRKPDADPKLAKRVLRSLSARLAPTKGGDFPRNTSPSFYDISALRNRFDLVYIMYSAMPIEMKPNLRLFQSFVDFRNARREVCRLALEYWSRLVQQEICNESSVGATGQKVSGYPPNNTLVLLREWHDSMVMDLLTEYLPTDDKALEFAADHHTSTAEPRDILSDKRKLVAEILKEALKAVEQSFGFCHSARQATELFSQRMLREVFKLFDAEKSTSTALISAALQVITAYTRSCVSETHPTAPADEDSQEYGSWDHFDVMDIDDKGVSDPNKDSFAYLLHEVQPMLRRFLSNVFGSDAAPNSAILKTTADCWYEVAAALVRVKARSWDDFMGQYSTDSWDSLRHTRQCQQYKVYTLAKIVDSDYGFYDANRLHILNLWISSLCHPTHLLSWEHFLSSVILFHGSNDELLFNPPFVVRSEAGDRIEIPMIELRERRSAMIYVIFRNMYTLLTTLNIAPQKSTPYCKADFSVILKSIESTMKVDYQDLEAHSQAQNEYRAFINFVVQQMQLYVVDFHKIDPFFMDPAISSAEEYAVTAALKRYSLTIQTTGVTKSMVLFFYSASERAAVHDTQYQLVVQLQNAFLDLDQDAIERTENHESDATVLTLFLQHVFSAYIGHAFSAPGHIVAGPVLQVLSYVYQNLRCRSDGWNPALLQGLTIASQVLFHNAVKAFRICKPDVILASYQRLDNFNELVVSIHAAMLRLYEAALAFPDKVEPSDLIEILLILKDHVLAIERPSDVESDILDIEADQATISDTAIEHSPMGVYAEKELQNALDKTWRQGVSGGWEIFGRGPAKVVKASTKTMSGVAAGMRMEQCKQRTSFVVREFLEAFARLDWWE
jgi:Mus7/MMS22 family